MADCNHGTYAIMDYASFYGTKRKLWFAVGCEKDCDCGELDECEEYKEYEEEFE